MSEFSRELLSFVEIARERSIRRAAEKLNVASSALSRQMRILESDLGAQLLLRDVRGVQLTDQGRLVLAQAEAWLDDSNRLRKRLSGLGDDTESMVRIGAMECFATTLIPHVFNYAQSELGFNRVGVTIGSTGSLLELLNTNALDLVIAFNAHHGQRVRVMSEVPCRVGLVYCPAQYSVEGTEISVADCLDWPICLPGEELSLHARLYAQILKQRKKPNIIATSNSVEFIRDVVVQGTAVGFLTWFDVRDDVLAGRLGFIPLADKRLTETLCVCVSGAPPLPRALATLARKSEALIAKMYENSSPMICG